MKLFGNKKNNPKPKEVKPLSQIDKLERWYAANGQAKGFDVSAIGFFNYIKKNHDHLL